MEVEGAERHRVKVDCYVLMENHLHLVAKTPEGNLSKWMHQLKTAYTVCVNRRHQVVGHLFVPFLGIVELGMPKYRTKL